MNIIKVIGIDPAPTKKSTIYDGENFLSKDYTELVEYIAYLKSIDENILICWDAPLSFSKESKTPFSKRIIEKFFSRIDGYKAPKGISVMGYSTCPHWIITQYILGYPKVGLEGYFNPPFELKFDKENILKSVTEVHPAIAIWLWTKNKTKINIWNYKKNKNVFLKLLNILITKGIIPKELEQIIENDDMLDAYIAWKLGIDWLDELSDVEILGNNDTGAFLLPNNRNLLYKYKNFKE